MCAYNKLHTLECAVQPLGLILAYKSDFITNHAHILLNRNRTKHVYSIYSRKPPAEVHSILTGMGVELVIVEDAWCFKHHFKPGCAFAEVWDSEEPDNRHRPLFCHLLHSVTPPGFQLVFVNGHYRVLRLKGQ